MKNLQEVENVVHVHGAVRIGHHNNTQQVSDLMHRPTTEHDQAHLGLHDSDGLSHVRGLLLRPVDVPIDAVRVLASTGIGEGPRGGRARGASAGGSADRRYMGIVHPGHWRHTTPAVLPARGCANTGIRISDWTIGEDRRCRRLVIRDEVDQLNTGAGVARTVCINRQSRAATRQGGDGAAAHICYTRARHTHTTAEGRTCPSHSTLTRTFP